MGFTSIAQHSCVDVVVCCSNLNPKVAACLLYTWVDELNRELTLPGSSATALYVG
jgi:hypothetical protein